MTLQECQNLMPDQLDRMGITLPGHQRRILASLNKITSSYDAYCNVVKPERSEQTGHPEVKRRDRPLAVPVQRKVEGDKMDGQMRPTPRERDKPVPKERRMQESSSEEGEMKPVPLQRHSAPGRVKEEERSEAPHEKGAKPVPKPRTKFCSNPSLNCPSTPVVSPMSDTSLPPVPPRINLNCPPQRFTSSPSSSPPAQRSGSEGLDRIAVVPPEVSTEAPRPQTLPIQLATQPLGWEETRKTSPISPTFSSREDKSIPPLPPKVGTKPPPPIPQRVPLQSPKTHR